MNKLIFTTLEDIKLVLNTNAVDIEALYHNAYKPYSDFAIPKRSK